jgi:hypothetical protein
MSLNQREDGMEREIATLDQTPGELEHEIERTRERMSSNIDALGEKLRPDNLKHQAKEAIAEKAQAVADRVGDQARLTGFRILDFITDHPLPVAAAALGVISLLLLRRGGRRRTLRIRRARLAGARRPTLRSAR